MRVWAFNFTIGENYDEREIEELFEILEGRGAQYHRFEDGQHWVRIPEDYDYLPFYETVKDCKSVSQIDDSIRLIHPTSLANI